MHHDHTGGWLQPLNLDIDIRYRNLRPFPARARRIWINGIALEVRGVTLPAGTAVELHFDVEGRPYQLPAVVAESRPGTLILHFDTPQRDLWQRTAAPWSLGLRPAPHAQPAIN